MAHDDKILENRTRGVYGEGGGIGHPEDECAVICEILQAVTLKCFPLKSHKDSNFPAKEQGIIRNVKLVAVRWSESTQKGSVEKKRDCHTQSVARIVPIPGNGFVRSVTGWRQCSFNKFNTLSLLCFCAEGLLPGMPQRDGIHGKKKKYSPSCFFIAVWLGIETWLLLLSENRNHP